MNAQNQAAQIGQKISNLGWRQGFVFQPLKDSQLASEISADEWLVVCTQSCSIAHPEPHIELMVAKPIKKFNPRSAEATGKNVRKFTVALPLLGSEQGLECDITKRLFVPKEEFQDFPPPEEGQPPLENRRAFAGWLGRYYTREALPNVLEHRLREDFYGILESIFKKKTDDDKTFEECLQDIYIKWKPNEELTDSGVLYKLEFMFLCKDPNYEDEIGLVLTEELAAFENDAGLNGVRITNWLVRSVVNTFISDLDNYVRFSHWDSMSGMQAVAAKLNR
jgi:hypothetical protein